MSYPMKNIILASILLLTSFSTWSQTNPLVKNVFKGNFPKGLSGRHIAVWHSHGFYYEQQLDRWEWQRARCFSNVEDIGNMPYVVTYLTPMLENAGAVVLNPRERDTQRNTFVVDADGSSSQDSKVVQKGRWLKEDSGYKHSETLRNYQNPFKEGTHLSARSSIKESASVTYIPLIPENKKGNYAVYVSWINTPQNVSDVTYKVYHTGGISEFKVNQKMYGATWHYLGTFNFDEHTAKVVVSNKSDEEGLVTTDAVRFGGGMGLVSRRPSVNIVENTKSNTTGKAKTETINPNDYTWKKSQIPSYLEAARYYLQFSGIPDSIYSRTKYQNDYNDDYQSRPHWVNFLKKHGIPIDLSLAFHTDAGVTPNDSIIGTLAIYSTRGDTFTDGRSKLLNGLMSGIIQNQIANDITSLYNSKWTKRQLRDASYSEASNQDVPSLLLELLSHQNLADMTYHLDPRFRFTVARAIYKGMTRFLNGPDATIQPLAPNSFAIEKLNGKKVKLSWKNTVDTLESSANSTSYRIYMKTDDNGFSDEYTEVALENATINLPEWGKRYSFKVTGVNDGGESFPTEELSVCLFNNNEKPALLVNGFTRVSAPSHFDLGEMAGFNWWEDEGVTDGYDMSFLGYQQDFNRKNPWLDDDNTGWGSSGVEGWGKLIRGNTHDFTHLHGKSYQKLGVSYVSMSRKAFETTALTKEYKHVDLMFGEQRYVNSFREDKSNFAVYTPTLIAKIDTLLLRNTPFLISGAYVGTDMVERKDSVTIKFAADKLGYTWRTNHASKAGEIYSVDKSSKYINGKWKYSNSIEATDSNGMPNYKVEAPDGIEPTKDSDRILRYSDTNISAGTFLNKNGNKVIVVGFPIESILNEAEKVNLMRQIIQIFNIK